MPVPVKVRTPRPAVAPAVPPLLDTPRPPGRRDPTAADVVRARTLAGNAAVTAAMGAVPVGEAPGPASWRGQILLAGQNLIGNQVVAAHCSTLPTLTTPKPQAPAAPVPKNLQRPR